jgi:hypothetical protein
VVASETEASNSILAAVVAVGATTVAEEVATVTTANNNSNKWEAEADTEKTLVEGEEGPAVVDSNHQAFFN